MNLKATDVVAAVIAALAIVQSGITTLSLPDGVAPIVVLALGTVSAFLVRLTSQPAPPTPPVA